jgi:hypothetical protein
MFFLTETNCLVLNKVILSLVYWVLLYVAYFLLNQIRCEIYGYIEHMFTSYWMAQFWS